MQPKIEKKVKGHLRWLFPEGTRDQWGKFFQVVHITHLPNNAISPLESDRKYRDP